MLYIELKKEIIDLGFETEEIYEEMKSVIINGINRAVFYINSNTIPLKNVCVIKKETTEIERFDLYELTDKRFESLADITTKETPDGLVFFSNYHVENGKTIVLNASGKFNFYYKERSERVPFDVEDNFEIKTDYRTEPLVAQLASHYIWLDDDERKAISYWNTFEQMKETILANYKPDIKSQVIHTQEGRASSWHD